MTRGVFRAIVTRVSGGRPYVRIPRHTGDLEYGPLDVLEGVYTLEGLETEQTAGGAGDSSFEAHGHVLFAGASRALKAGDRVLVSFVEGRVDDPVILGRLG